jgi:hypothetical protein
MDAVQFGPVDAMGYRRPPVTVSFEDLRRRGLPQVLFVHSFLPEGVTVCDINVFATMIEEAYHTPGTLHMHTELDDDGNQQCVGIGNNGTWEWETTRPTAPRGGQQYTSCRQAIGRILLAPEREGLRLCTVDPLWPEPDPLASTSPVTFPIRTRPRLRRRAAGLG